MKKRMKLCVFAFARMLYRLFWIFPMRDKVLVSAYRGKGYCDNPKYIVDELLKQKRYDICCIVNDSRTEVPNYIRIVKKNTISELFEYATSHVLINNTRFPLYIAKRPHQIYIETWHGGFPLKKIGLAMQDIDEIGVASVMHDAKSADAMISSGDFCTEVYRRDFAFSGEILEVGSPRLDPLFSTKEIDELTKIFPMIKGKKVVLYAPTFRDGGDTTVYDIDFARLKESLERRFDGEWIIIVRFHPNMQEYANKLDYSEWLINGTQITDIYSVLRELDCMISDYSSIGFEYSLTQKPLFLYAKDLDEYKNDRGLYFNIEKLPFPIAENNDGLMAEIESFDENNYRANIQEWIASLGCKENGSASRAVADYIIKMLTSESKCN